VLPNGEVMDIRFDDPRKQAEALATSVGHIAAAHTCDSAGHSLLAGWHALEGTLDLARSKDGASAPAERHARVKELVGVATTPSGPNNHFDDSSCSLHLDNLSFMQRICHPS
jgi:hypothetical protein